MDIQTDIASNQVVYSYVLNAHKEEVEKEIISIFKYHPKRVEDVSVRIEYDQQVNAEYDIMNTISFVDK